MSRDLNKEKPFKHAVLRDRNGDLTKEWYVEYYAWDETKNNLIRNLITMDSHKILNITRRGKTILKVASCFQIPLFNFGKS